MPAPGGRPIITETREPSPEAVAVGHAFYTRRSLAVYDLMILGYFSRVAWRCPAGGLVDHHDRHVTADHLDVGVGTGYFLDRCRFPSVDRNWYARVVMRWNNRRRIFSIAHDDVEGLHRALEKHLDDVTIEIIGCVALFAGRARSVANGVGA